MSDDDIPTEEIVDLDGDDHPLSKARRETLAIPRTIRDAVDARDGQYCRVCGRYLGDARALHHIEYGGTARGMGGRRIHTVEGIITVCWLWAGNCHERVHSDKHKWQPILREVLTRPGTTAFQLLRWQARTPAPLPPNRRRRHIQTGPSGTGCDA